MTDSGKFVSVPRRLGGKDKKVPDGWKVTYGNKVLCDSEFTSKTIKSAFDYEHEATSSMGFVMDIGPISFGMSSESREFRDNNGKERKMMVTTKAECMEFTMEM